MTTPEQIKTIIAAAPGTMALAVSMSLSESGEDLVINTFEAPIVAWEIVDSRPHPIIVGEVKIEVSNNRTEYGLIVSDDSIVEMSGSCLEPFTREEFVDFVSDDVFEQLRADQARINSWNKIRQGKIPSLFAGEE